MFSKLLTLVLLVGFAQTAFAEEAKKEEPKTWKDKLSLSFHGEFGIVRKDSTTNDNVYGDSLGKLKDFTHFYNPSVGYKIADNLSLSTSFEFKYADHAGRPKFVNRFYRALVSLSRSNLLTEKEHGIQLDAGIARRYFDRVSNRTTYGNDRVNVTLTKSWEKSNNASVFLQYLANDPKDATSRETWRRGVEIIPTLNLQLTDKLTLTSTDDINLNTPWYGNVENDITWSHEFNFAVFTYKFNDIVSTYLQLKYNYSSGGFNHSGSDRATAEDYDYYVGVAYSLTPKFTLTGEVGSPLFESHDGKSAFSKKASNPEFTLYVDASY